MSRRPRILIGGLYHETHTFLAGLTGWNDFRVQRCAELLAAKGDSSPLGGALAAAEALGWEVVPTLNAQALPSSMVADEVLERFWEEFRVVAIEELMRGIDGIYLVLHGAMTCESTPDVEGEFLERLAALPGVGELPVFGVFDLHANFTARMAAYSHCLVGYRENPHVDARESAVRVAHLLDRSLLTGQRPMMSFAHPPIVWPPTGTATNADPMRSLLLRARALEKRYPEFWEVSVVGGFAFADTPETGVSFTIVSTGSSAQAETALAELCARALELAPLGNVIEEPAGEVLGRISVCAAGLTVLAEPSENVGAGARGDGTGLLRALLEHKAQNAAVSLCDPDGVEQLCRLRPGDLVTLALGGRSGWLGAGPLSLEVELIELRDGRFELEDKQSHLAAASGDWFDMGLCAVVRHCGITILLTSNRTPPLDLGQWRHVGLPPEKFSIIGVKAAVAHRRAYDPIAARHYWVDTPGPCSSRLVALPYRRLIRPIYPLDPLEKLNFNRGQLVQPATMDPTELPANLMTNPDVSYPKSADTPTSHLPFSPCVAYGDLLFISGQASVDATGQIITDTFEGEFRRSVENLQKILESAGSDLAHVVQVKSYVRDDGDLPLYNQLYREYFNAPYPARSTITHCLGKALRFELDAIAVKRKS